MIGQWMLERYKELIKEGKADCIRFVDVISFVELDELVTICFQNNVNVKERALTLYMCFANCLKI